MKKVEIPLIIYLVELSNNPKKSFPIIQLKTCLFSFIFCTKIISFAVMYKRTKVFLSPFEDNFLRVSCARLHKPSLYAQMSLEDQI